MSSNARRSDRSRRRRLRCAPDRLGRRQRPFEQRHCGGVGGQPSTVGRWRGRFAASGVDGLHDHPRLGQPRKITDADIERVIVTNLESRPADATHWSTRSMAKVTAFNQTAISRIWRTFGLKHRTVTSQIHSAQVQSGSSAPHLPRIPRRPGSSDEAPHFADLHVCTSLDDLGPPPGCFPG